MLKHRMQKSWPQSSEMGSRSLSRQMEQVGGSRVGEGRCPRPSSSLGNDAWDLEGRTSSECWMPVGCRVWRSDSLGVKAPLCNLGSLRLPEDTSSTHSSLPCESSRTEGRGYPREQPSATIALHMPAMQLWVRAKGEISSALARAVGNHKR